MLTLMLKCVIIIMKGGLSHQKGGRLGKEVDAMSVKIISALIESIKEIVRKSNSIDEIL